MPWQDLNYDWSDDESAAGLDVVEELEEDDSVAQETAADGNDNVPAGAADQTPDAANPPRKTHSTRERMSIFRCRYRRTSSREC